MVVLHILDAQVAEHLVKGLADMGEGHGAVVRIVLLDEYMTIEAAHLRNSEDADAAE